MKRKVSQFYLYLLITWTLFRMLFSLPEWADELIVKPLIWLGPILILKNLKLATQKSTGLVRDLFLGSFLSLLILGEYLLANRLRGTPLTFNPGLLRWPFFLPPLIIAAATGLTEEIVFRGYIMGSFLKGKIPRFRANLLTTVLFIGIHLPIVFFYHQARGTDLLTTLLTMATLSLVDGVAFSTTRSLVAPIAAHTTWNFLLTFLH